MRLFDAKMAPYPRRVTIYLAEKKIDLERIEVDLHAMEQRSPAFLQMNPAGKVPVLELDSGAFLPESAAIVEYLEEIYPSPSMFGETAEERAQIRATERIASEIFTLLAQVLLHTVPAALEIHPGLVQHPQVGEALQPLVGQLLDQLEARMEDHNFLAGPSPTAADCTFFALMDAVYSGLGYVLPDRCPRLRAWYMRFQQRPSARMT
ncbi:MAG TPA: glutathione S-transferase family protein [Steroidobacteraceae bacterium]|jgi:glutathione S-transferase|nr:glutathione S-transferase family protein [Steroidobacteraceae bacterium]